MEGINGFSVAISQLDQERRRLSLLQEAEREKRQQQQEIFDLTKQKLELENERLQMDNKKLTEESQMRVKTLEHTGALMSAWTEYMAAADLPQTESSYELIRGTQKHFPVDIIRGTGGTKRKTDRAREIFDEALLKASSEAPGAIQQLFAITEGLSKMENLPEETKARLGYLRAQTDVMRGKTTGGAESAADVKAAIEAELKGREVLDKKLGAEGTAEVDQRWVSTIAGKKDSIAAVTTNTQQLLATLAGGFISSEDQIVKEVGANLQKAGSVFAQSQARTNSARDAYSSSALLDRLMEELNTNTVKQSIVTEDQKNQYQQLRSNLSEARRGAQELGQLYEQRDQEQRDIIRKKEIAHSLFGQQLASGANAHVAATRSAETTLRLFGEIKKIEEENLDRNAAYVNAQQPDAGQEDQDAAMAAIRSAAGVPNDKGASDYNERLEVFNALMAHYKARRTAKAHPYTAVAPSPSILK